MSDFEKRLAQAIRDYPSIVSFVGRHDTEKRTMVFTCMVRDNMEGNGNTPLEALNDALSNSTDHGDPTYIGCDIGTSDHTVIWVNGKPVKLT